MKFGLRLFLFGVVALAAIGVVGLAADSFREVVLVPLAEMTGLTFLTKISAGMLGILFVLALPGRWTAIPMSYRIHATTDIDAPVSQVWDMIAPRTRDTYWGSSITHTTLNANDPSRIDFHFEGTEDIGAPPILECVIEANEPEAYYAYRPLNADKFPLFAGDVVLSEMFLEDIGGRTRVRFVESLDRVRLLTIPLLMFLNPCRDSLIRMKALGEGREDTSWMGRKSEELRQGTEEQVMSVWTIFKWMSLALIPLAFTLFLLSVIGG